MRLRRDLVVAFGLTTFVGCGASSPEAPTDPTVPPMVDYQQILRMRYPSQHYLAAIGASEHSIYEAESMARAEIANQIRSSIESELLVASEEGQTSSTSAGDASQIEYTSLVSSRIRSRTTFSHNELIRVDRNVPQTGGRHTAIAFLDRAVAADRLQEDYGLKRGELDSALLAYERASGEAHPPAVATAWHDVSRSFSDLIPIAADHLAIRGARPVGFAEDESRFRAAHDDRRGFAARIHTVLIVESSAEGAELESSRRTIESSLRSGMARLGLNPPSVIPPRPATDPCRSDASRVVLIARPELRWKRSPTGGPLCELTVPASLYYCDTGETLATFDLSGTSIKGAHPSDRSRAVESAVGQFDEAFAAERLHEGLRYALPVNVPAGR